MRLKGKKMLKGRYDSCKVSVNCICHDGHPGPCKNSAREVIVTQQMRTSQTEDRNGLTTNPDAASKWMLG